MLDAFDIRKYYRELRELKNVAKFITTYVAKEDFNTTPCYQAFKEGNVDLIKLFIKSPLTNFYETDDQGYSIYYHVYTS